MNYKAETHHATTKNLWAMLSPKEERETESSAGGSVKIRPSFEVHPALLSLPKAG
jgi:hypothetical protein